jgi:hypothetical protein
VLATMKMTDSMEHSPYPEADSRSASQKITLLSWNPKVHFQVQKSPPLVPILSQMRPVHTLYSISTGSILILSSHLRLGLPSGIIPSGFPD